MARGRILAALALVLQGCAVLSVEQEPTLPGAQWKSRAGHPGLVIGVPQASPDDLTERISLDLAGQTGFGLVVATGLVRDRRDFDEAYRLQVNQVARGPLRLYVEIHGGSRPDASGQIKIGTVGVGRDEAWKLKTLFELIRDAHLRSRRELPRLDVLVQPVQLDAAAGATPLSAVHSPERGIQIQLPSLVQTVGREVYTEILAEFLRESSRLLLARGK
jgi:hypothetical protein